ncbi:MAG: acetolactate synthase large subunit [Steroidobacteraceae bacterium]
MRCDPVKGAQAILETLGMGGVDTIFANPGTSEMALVRALDEAPGVRAVLGLFEGVVTGAADGFARMSGRPAATLLHLGPGLANGCANLHNARRARSAIVNVVGEHARDHIALDAPLTTDIEAIARPFSVWVHRIAELNRAGQDTAHALVAARKLGGPATLIVPADIAWSDGARPATPWQIQSRAAPDSTAIEQAAATIRQSGMGAMLLLGGDALDEKGIAAAARLAAATGVRIASETFNARAARGAGRLSIPRVPYFGDAAEAFLADVDALLLVESREPVNFFGYPGRRGRPLAPQTVVSTVAAPGEDGSAVLLALAEMLAPTTVVALPATSLPERPSGAIHAASFAAALARRMPEGAIFCEESITASFGLPQALAAAAPHDELDLMGGAIGGSLPLATGAALARPDRRVICASGDGSALYTIQALWTQARENLDVTTIICANRSYAILAYEHLQIEGRPPGPRALPVLSLDQPALGFAALARGFGVEAETVETAEALDAALAAAAMRRGPFLIEAVFAPMALPAAPNPGRTT